MSVSSIESRASQGRTTHAEEKTISDKLARKRVLDRKAQQAARSRAKWNMENLQHQVAQLNNALISETSRLKALLDESKDETERIRVENRALKMQLENSKFDCSNPFLGDMGFATPNILLPVPVPYEAESPRQAVDMVAPRSISVSSPSLNLYECVPWSTGPTCVSDRILQSYVATARMRVHATSDIFLKEQPDMSALLAQARSTESPGVSNVVSDILLAYQEINTLPKKAACLYVMYKLLNWLIFRTKSTYDQMPAWLRPVPLQLQMEHPAWIDRIPWPNARIYLINNPSITFDDFASCYSSDFHVSWPYEHSHVFISLPSNGTSTSHSHPATSPSVEANTNTNPFSTPPDMEPEVVLKNWFPPHDRPQSGEPITSGGVVLNPVFEQHLRQLKNWSVSDVFRRRFPDLGVIIESDSRLDSGN
ncbi:hypothetical protein K505DRAFT_374580 [Melanomma pulvis-pyrius CBS 109.77]|uniref:BZIP domain-containing protein n=1 Tax=Melanomma pulvis-pyrius CBS 109.77 TaxID=1314802 RepID=A0A6A6XEG0_9PLEO|nr:hypothetical protein K505DRAFT_374580 [Melanomma pulvis-pyrius CBS 109.77]